MSSYTITITPDDTTNASATLRVNLGTNGPRITELTMRAGDGEGFAPEDLPGFDLARLIGAFAPSRVIEAAPAAALPAGTAPVEVVHARTAEDGGPRGRGRPRKAAKVAKKAAAPKAAKATKATRKAAAKATRSSGRDGARAYRRMPEDILEVFGQAGGATALANHYGVPRHTAQGWLRRLRQQGDLPS